MPYLIGLDIGTSAAKAVLTGADGHLLAWASREYPIHVPQPGWAEQDPADWLSAAYQVLREVVHKAGVKSSEIAGIGLTGQMHSLTPVDGAGNPVRRAIIWADQRSGRQVRGITSQLGHQKLALRAGNPLAAGFMLASWAWMRENEPRLADATRLLMLPKDWVRLKLTGQVGSEPSDASSTLLFDPHIRAWSQPLMAQVGLTADRLPPLFESGQVAGGLLEDAARASSLVAGTPVVFGCSDVSAQALALGVTTPGIVSVTIGTGGQLFAPTPKPLHDPELRMHLFCHALPNLWHYEAAILSGGLSLRWLRDQIWPDSDFDSIANAAAGTQAAMDGLFFLPFLTGERTPYMDPGLQAVFFGLGLRHGRPEMARAAMEGVVFALRQGLDLLSSLGPPVERLVVSGGATRHPLWLQLQADIFDRPVFVYDAPEATARGAALLAAAGSGVYPSIQAAIQQAASAPVRLVTPNPRDARRYQTAYHDWLEWANMVADRYRLADIKG